MVLVTKMIWWLGLLALWLQSFFIIINTALSLYLHNLQFTVVHTLGFSVSTSRLLATDPNRRTIKVLLNHTLPISMYYSTCDVTRCLLILLLATVLFPWNFGIQTKSIYYSLPQLMTARKRPSLSPTNIRCGSTENTSRGLYPLLCDVTAYAEVCLLSRFLETGCITPLF
jgi:hypothetical protein